MRTFIILILCLLLPALAHAQNQPMPETVQPYFDRVIPNQYHSAAPETFEPQGTEAPYTYNTEDNIKRARQVRELQRLQKDIEAETPKPTRIEAIYARRTGEELQQYGYDLLGLPQGDAISATERPPGAVPDDFVLNFGDRLDVIIQGQINHRETVRITQNGQIVIKDFAPVMAAGQSLGALKASLRELVKDLPNTRVFVSLVDLRPISVLVVGHVKTPGRYSLSPFHSALDAIGKAGGITKQGSLRQVKIVRGGKNQNLDLYKVITGNSHALDLTLRDGDRIMIQPLGHTVAVAGAVKQPGIYELAYENQALSLQALMDLSGGLLMPGASRYLKLTPAASGHEETVQVRKPGARQFTNGSILLVEQGTETRMKHVLLKGHTTAPGPYALSETPTLQALLANKTILGPDIYPLFAVIKRWNEDRLAYEYLTFSPEAVIQKREAMTLHEKDEVTLFSINDIVDILRDNDTSPQQKQIHDVSFSASMKKPDEALDIETKSILREQLVHLRGAVRNEGSYPITEGVTAESVLAVAGGMALNAATNNIEITSRNLFEGREVTQRVSIDLRETHPSDIFLSPGDTIRVNQLRPAVESKTVQVKGAVLNPGTYDLLPDDTLSDLLERAGGLTNWAYAEGAVFSRESERKREETKFRAAARDLERSISVMLEDSQTKGERINENQVRMARDLAAELRDVQAVGRITVEADPGILAAQPELDVLLEPGDRLYVPKRPSTVRVAGEVQSPAALQFRENKKPSTYIQEAGGFTYNADKSRTFVVYPDGSAEPLHVSAWNYKAIKVPPGSTIIVPRDPKPFDFVERFRDITGILSNLAITGIFIDDIRED